MNEENRFAKIFELNDLGDHQVLITKVIGEEPGVVQTTYFEECMPKMTLGFDTDEEAEECFENYDIKQAKKFFDSVYEMLK